jgi:integrase
MSVSRLPNGRWRAQTYHQGKTVSAAKVLGLPPEQATFSSRRKAEDAVTEARKVLARRRAHEVTVGEWAETWTTDPFWARPKESTNIDNARRVRRLVAKYGDIPLAEFGDRQVGEIVRGPRGTLHTVRAMFRDAMRIEAGRLIDRDPFQGVKLSKGKGNGQVDPPGEDVVWGLVEAGRELVNPGFGAWLQVAAFTGLRPGELDALRWERVDWEAGRIRVVEQFNSISKSFTLPKNGLTRDALLTPQAREALEVVREFERSPFCFTNLRGRHWRNNTRDKHWFRVRAEVGYEGSLYLGTRHFAASYMVNTLGLPDTSVAIALGHTDGGALVRTTYGHRDKSLVLDEIQRAYESVGNVVRIAPVPGSSRRDHTEASNVAR